MKKHILFFSLIFETLEINVWTKTCFFSNESFQSVAPPVDLPNACFDSLFVLYVFNISIKYLQNRTEQK